jgi:hypothetical protein
MDTIALYDSAASTFTMTKAKWSGTFPIEDLPKWLEFYRNQQARYPIHAASYDSSVKALEKLVTLIGVRSPPP